MYEAVLARLAVPLAAWPHFEGIAAACGVPVDTVHSIYSQEVQSRVRRGNHLITAAAPEYARRYLAGEARRGGGSARCWVCGRRRKQRAAATAAPPTPPATPRRRPAAACVRG